MCHNIKLHPEQAFTSSPIKHGDSDMTSNKVHKLTEDLKHGWIYDSAQLLATLRLGLPSSRGIIINDKNKPREKLGRLNKMQH